MADRLDLTAFHNGPDEKGVVLPPGREFREGETAVLLTRAEWENRFTLAKELMKERRSLPRALIEIAAQHPLIDGRLPNPEFAERLEKGAKIFRELVSEGKQVEIYVPGSRHCYEGIADDLSLSEGGRVFLIERGIPAQAIHGDDLNARFKGEEGVYNSADECFVTASYFKSEGFGSLHAIVSPVQLMRKSLHYVWFGVLPLIHTAPTEQTYHNLVREAFDALPHVLFEDPSVQGSNSAWSVHSRATRMPKYQ